jgi:hypothetical protein
MKNSRYNTVDGRVISSNVFTTHRVTRHNNILSTAPHLSISLKALTLPEDGNVMQKYVGATINN